MYATLESGFYESHSAINFTDKLTKLGYRFSVFLTKAKSNTKAAAMLLPSMWAMRILISFLHNRFTNLEKKGTVLSHKDYARARATFSVLEMLSKNISNSLNSIENNTKKRFGYVDNVAFSTVLKFADTLNFGAGVYKKILDKVDATNDAVLPNGSAFRIIKANELWHGRDYNFEYLA